MTLDLIIVGFRSEAQLPRLLEDLRAMTATPYTVYFRDNTKENRNLQTVRAELAAKGNGQYMGFLNPDIFLCPGWDAHLIDALAHEEYGVATALPVGDARCEPLWSALVPSDRLPPYPPSVNDMKALAKFLKDQRDLSGSEYFSNHASLMKRATWDVLAGYDERFRFLDADRNFAQRMQRLLEQTTAVVRSCPIFHGGRESVIAATAHGEFDRSAEEAHRDWVVAALRKKEWWSWHELGREERAAIRARPEFQCVGGAK